MYPALKRKPNLTPDWQPTADLETLSFRAQVLAQIRAFFQARNILEVETPTLGLSSATDPHLQSFIVQAPSQAYQTLKSPPHYYLQTSPEFFMKRLLAAGSGAIYQITKAYRAGEAGRLHNPEFTLLEWYQVGFDHHQLIVEVAELLQTVLKIKAWDIVTYQTLFNEILGINPHTCNWQELKICAQQKGLDISSMDTINRDDWLDFLFAQCIQPQLGQTQPVFITEYPASQAMLARIDTRPRFPIAERFELFVQGVELANGFHELKEADEQRLRFEQDNKRRKQLGLPRIPVDTHLLAALPSLPDCAGVALGIDRLLLVATGLNHIHKVTSFTHP